MLLFPLILAHYICDFALQTEWMANNKNPFLKGSKGIWIHAMSGHCATHALAVYLLTGSQLLAAFEFATHFLIDIGKTSKSFGFHLDQGLHLLCKVVWVILIIKGVI